MTSSAPDVADEPAHTPPIVVAGGINLDLVVRTPRLPRPGETVHGRDYVQAPGGKGGNQAAAVARLGGNARLLALVGDDEHGGQLVAGLAADGIDGRWVQTVPGAKSGLALIAVADDGENSIIVAPGANARADASAVRRVAGAFEDARVVVGNLEWPHAAIAAVLAQAPPGAIRLLNAAPAYREVLAQLAGVDWLAVNEHEAHELSGKSVTDPASAIEAGRALRRLGLRHAVVTLGAAGAVLVSDKLAFHQPAPSVDVVDTTAAGDAFTGALAVALAEGRTPEWALRFAVAAGSLACTVLGARPSLPRREAAEEWAARMPEGRPLR